MAKKSYWQTVSLDSERSRAATLSWFKPLSDGMTPYKAEILCDIETDDEKKIRAFVRRDDDGRHFKLERTLGGKRYSMTRSPIPIPPTTTTTGE